MMTLKKYIAAFLACVLALTLVPCIAFAEDEIIPADENMKMLKTFGIYDESYMEKGEIEVTRRDYAKIMVALNNNVNPNVSEIKFFSDIEKNDKDLSAIVWTCDRNYIDIVGDGMFYPDKTVTENECIRAAIMTLGYDYLAKVDASYRNWANKLNLLNGTSLKQVTFRSFARFIMNVLKTKPLEFTYGSGQKLEVSDETYLESALGIYKDTGIVYANERTHLYKDIDGEKGKVQIGETKYKTSLDIDEYLGYKLDYYYRDTGDDFDDLLYVYGVDRNRVNIIKSNDIISISDGKVEFYNSREKKNSLTLSREKYVIYNGRPLSAYSESMLLPTDGYIKLIDNDANGTSDVMIVCNYKYIVADIINTYGEKIYDKFSSDAIDLTGVDEYRIFKGGKQVELKYVTKGNVLKIMCSADGKYADIYATDSAKTFKVSGISYKDNRDIDEITAADGTKYKVSENGLLSLNNEADSIKVNSRITLYLDDDGIAVAVALESEGNFGYLINIIEDNEGFDTDIYAKILTTDGEIKRYKLIDKPYVDGAKVKKENVISLIGEDNNVQPQIIRYNLNSNDNISVIDTAYNYNKQTRGVDYASIMPTNGESVNSFRAIYAASLESSPNPLWYKNQQMAFGRQQTVSYTSNCVVFVVPSDPKNADEDDFIVTNPDGYFVNDYTYDIDAFSCNESLSVCDAIVYVEAGSTGQKENFSIYRVGVDFEI